MLAQREIWCIESFEPSGRAKLPARGRRVAQGGRKTGCNTAFMPEVSRASSHSLNEDLFCSTLREAAGDMYRKRLTLTSTCNGVKTCNAAAVPCVAPRVARENNAKLVPITELLLTSRHSQTPRGDAWRPSQQSWHSW